MNVYGNDRGNRETFYTLFMRFGGEKAVFKFMRLSVNGASVFRLSICCAVN